MVFVMIICVGRIGVLGYNFAPLRNRNRFLVCSALEQEKTGD